MKRVIESEDIYFSVIEHLNIEHLCIEDDPDGGTRNTEYGRDLYNMIDDLLTERLDEMINGLVYSVERHTKQLEEGEKK